MKKSIYLLTALVAVVLFGCKEEPYINGPGDNEHNVDSIPILKPDTNGILVSVDEAIAICDDLADNGETSEVYKIEGYVCGNTTHPYEIMSGKTNINFALTDNGMESSLACYYINNVNNLAFRSPNAVPRSGSKVTVCGVLTKYVSKSGKVTPELKNGFLVRVDELVAPPFEGCPEPGAGELSVNDAIHVSDSIGSGNTTSSSYKIRGVVVTIDLPSEGDLARYGNFTFSITSDGKRFATCYRLKGKGNGKFSDYDQLQIGDTVLINAKIQNYNDICEPTSGYVEESSNPLF